MGQPGKPKVVIRPALADDAPAIAEIYNEAIETTVATFDTQPVNAEERRLWLAEHGGKYPVMVAELDDSIVGWASLSKWSGRCAYADTAEISLYVLAKLHGRGIGRVLMATIIEEGRQAGLHTVIARIVEGNEVSVHLHEVFGFHSVGVLREVGRKFGKLLDIHIMQKIFQ